MDATRVDLTGLFHEIIEQLRTEQPEPPTRVEVQDNLYAWGDAGLLRVVMENLLGNAWKYSRETDEPAIRFSASRIAGDQVFKVEDNGAGFNMEYADKLFEVFQRLHGKEIFEGTGVGLATVKRVIDRHHGRIWAEAEVDRGASFFFTLPEEADSGRDHTLQL